MRNKVITLAGAMLVAFLLCGGAAWAQHQAATLTSGPAVKNVTPTSATVTWSTNVPASSTVRYGTTNDRLDQTAQTSWGGTNHKVELKNLKPGTMYFFEVESGQALGTGTGAMSRMGSFTTPGQATAGVSAGQPSGTTASSSQGAHESKVQVLAGPIVQEVQQPGAVDVWWSTNSKSSTILKYGTNPNSLTQRAEQPWGEQAHSVRLTNLQPGANYYYQVVTSAGRLLDQGTFQVPTAQQESQQFKITHGPEIEKLGPNSVVVAWTTNVPASSTVHYGTEPNNLNQVAQAAWGQQTHRVTVSNLQPNTKYYFQVSSSQAQGTGQTENSAVFQAMTESAGQQAMSFNTH